MTPKIALDEFVALGVDEQQAALFTKVFGRSTRVDLDEASLVQAAQVGLDVDWWFYRMYPDLRAEYMEAAHSAFIQYTQDARDTLPDLPLDDPKRVKELDALWVEYNTRVAPIIWQFLIEHGTDKDSRRTPP